MRKDKEYIFSLRKQGKTYRQIQRETGVSRATLCAWFQDVEWSKHIEIRNSQKNHSPEQMEIARNVRIKKLEELYKIKEEEAFDEYNKYKNDALFWAGIMAYAGEGDKRSRNLVRITNSEFYIHKIFIKFALQYMGILVKDIRFSMIIYPDLNESLCKEMWSNILGIPRDQFHKTQVIQGKEKLKRLQYGVGMSIISSTVLKKKINKWISLAQDETFEKAVIV